MKPAPKRLGLDPPAPSDWDFVLGPVFGRHYIPERRATFEALVPDRYKVEKKDVSEGS